MTDPADSDETTPDPAAVAAQVRDEFCGPGGPWETAVEDVLGQPQLVFVNRHRSVRAMLEAGAGAHADVEFLVLGDTRLTYGEVLDRVAATADRLHTEFGIDHGDRVAILAANRPEWVITFFATVSLGGIVSALNGWWTAAEIDHAVAMTEPKVLVGDARRIARAGSLPEGLAIVDMDERADVFAPSPDGEPIPMPSVAIDEDDPALILFTSGTTGRSKGATVSHRGLIGFVDGTSHNAEEKTHAALRFMGIDPATIPAQRQILLNTSPLFHVSGLLAGILMHVRAGSTIVFREGRFDPGDVLRLIEKERITSWSAIGAMAPMVLDHPDLDSYDTSSLTRVGSGGAHTPEHIQKRLAAAFPQAAHAIGQGYGSSETVGVVTSIGGQEFKDHPDSAGAPCMGFEIEIRDPEGNACPEGVDGHVNVRSAYTMLGYWGDPAATAEALDDQRWLDTGDIGQLRDGRLYLNSRARDMILRGAENIYPAEIEFRLDAHPDVGEVAVMGVDHPQLGQEVKAVIVPTGAPSPSAPFDPEALAAWCGETLAAYKVPTVWERRDEPLPRTASGKVVKAAITGEREISGHQD